MALDFRFQTFADDVQPVCFRCRDLRQQFRCRFYCFPERSFLLGEAGCKGLWILLIGHSGFHDGQALLRLVLGTHHHAQAELVQEMLAQLALFRVHGAHQHKTAVADSGNAFPLHPVLLGAVGSQNDIGQMILQQVHFVHIKDLTVSFGKDSGKIHSFSGFHGLLQIHGTDEPVFRHRQGQGDDLFVGQFPQGPDGGRLGCTLLSGDQHTADPGIY